MISPSALLTRCSFCVLGGVAVALALAPAAGASNTVPYNDPGASGAITLCDKNLKPMTEGYVDDRPFVWRAVGSEPAPSVYAGEGRKAQLFIYQPRKGVAPAAWTGNPLTAASTYSNPDHPIAQATVIDYALDPYLQSYPPRWDGWMQLRLYYIGTDGPLSNEYAASDLQISGNTWKLVNGGSAPCDAGDAVSPELALPNYSASAKAVARQQAQREAARATLTASSMSPTPSPSAVDKTMSASGTQLAAGQQADGTGSRSSAVWWVLAGLVVVVALGLGAYFVRGRPSSTH
ncbi:MAG: hypothetical protein WAN48_12355 [Actinomycetes bacterium]